MKTGVVIEWDFPDDELWLNPDNIKIALESYCPNTKFKVWKIGIENGNYDKEIDIDYLRIWHPELTDEELESLLSFSKENTITHQVCYGDGSIIYPLWEKWRAKQG